MAIEMERNGLRGTSGDRVRKICWWLDMLDKVREKLRIMPRFLA